MSFELLKKGLEANDITILKEVSKSDLHSHGVLGGKLEHLEVFLKKKMPKQPSFFPVFDDFENYLGSILNESFSKGESGFDFLFASAFVAAANDNVKKLEMSIDCGFTRFHGGVKGVAAFIDELHKNIAPDTEFIPELGIPRGIDVAEAEKLADEWLSTGYFKAVDLYGDELAKDASEYVNLYKTAERAGLKLKAHAGEYGNAESVRYTVEKLNLEAVQHGISAADSLEVMRWLSERGTVLNVCPTSNVKLGRAASYKEHQARKLFDNGVKITINSDDLMIFGATVSDEYLNLYKNGLFTVQELDVIRKQGLK